MKTGRKFKWTLQRPRKPLRRIQFIVGDLIDRWRYRDGMVPPRSLDFVGGGDFEASGREFDRYFVELAKLQPDHCVLDVGCGIGRMAIPLTNRLSRDGVYYGFDIVALGIDWCNRRIVPRFPNFHFLHSDIYNKLYNPGGTIQAKDYDFPFDDGFFDFVFLTSVFTHMLRQDMHNYLSEIARVLKPGGRCLATFFLLNEESTHLSRTGQSTQNFTYELDGCFAVNQAVPERAIAYAEDVIVWLFRENRLNVNPPIHYGSWCGRPQYLSYQDLLVATKV